MALAQFSMSQVVMFQNLLCLRDISCSFVLMAFKLKHLVSIDKTFNWLTFHDRASIFNVTSLCFKIINFAR